ncbi:MAG: GGDEF domain-containing protein [Pseudomonadota bacterium]
MHNDTTIFLSADDLYDEKKQSLANAIREVVLIPVISVIDGKNKGKIHPFKNSVMIGRGKNADFNLLDELISRNHLRVSLIENTFMVEDLGSTNGTYVDGNKVEKIAIIPGAIIHIGDTKLVCSFKSSVQIESEKELYQAATTDYLTGISNRLWFMKRAGEEISYAQYKGVAITIIMLDIDYFKKVNDDYGHPAGDYVLKKAASILLQHKRDKDLLGRYGGEEFILLLKGLTSQKSHTLAERIRKAIEAEEFIFNQHKIPITISLGVCTMATSSDLSLANNIAIADKLLYKAKHNGRNRVEINNEFKQ